jgi:hypothetical protein
LFPRFREEILVKPLEVFPHVDRRTVFRVVRYLPGPPRATTTPDLRAGVSQASMEETAKNANAGVQGANAMGIWAAA